MGEKKSNENLSQYLAGIKKQLEENDIGHPISPEEEMAVENTCRALVLLVTEAENARPDDDGEGKEAGSGSRENEEGEKEEKEEGLSEGKEMRDKGKGERDQEGEGKEIVPVVVVEGKEGIKEEGVGVGMELVVRGGMELVEEEEGKRKRKRGRPKEDPMVRPEWLPEDWAMHCVMRQQGESLGRVDRYFYNPGPDSYKFRSKTEVLHFIETGIPPRTYKISKKLREQQQQQQQGPVQEQEEGQVQPPPQDEEHRQPPPPQDQQLLLLPPPPEVEQPEVQEREREEGQVDA